MTLTQAATRAIAPRPTIVLVDDDDVVRLITKLTINKFLDEKGLTGCVDIREFTNCEDALAYLSDHKPNRILITDAEINGKVQRETENGAVEVNRMSGFELLQKLQARGAMPDAAGLYSTLPVSKIKQKYENRGLDALYIPIIGGKPGAAKEEAYPQGYTPVTDIVTFLRGYAYAPLGLNRDIPPASAPAPAPK